MENMNSTPKANRVHIGIFGRRNAGKSSIINAIAGQEVAIVSDLKGTTTDPVEKAMELLPIGPVVLIDTPGLDDEGEIGELRIKKAFQAMRKTDVAILVIDCTEGVKEEDEKIRNELEKRKIPYIIVFNKADLCDERNKCDSTAYVSGKTGKNIDALKELIAGLVKEKKPETPIVSDLINPGDAVVLVVPIDSSAPKGRLILPQQQTIRDILDSGASAFVCRDSELKATLEMMAVKPKLVITDSQVFKKVSQIVPEDVALTSFSILFARHKGDLKILTSGVEAIKDIKDGDRILIAEGCTHHRQCEDIGSVKIPKMLRAYCQKEIEIDFTSGGEFPSDISGYKLIIHCGGCMLNEREMKYRLNEAEANGIPIVNYGVLLAQLSGILERSLEPLFYNI